MIIKNKKYSAVIKYTVVSFLIINIYFPYINDLDNFQQSQLQTLMSTPVKVFSRIMELRNTCYWIFYGGCSITFTLITPHTVSTFIRASKPRARYATRLAELFTEGVVNLIATSTTKWLRQSKWRLVVACLSMELAIVGDCGDWEVILESELHRYGLVKWTKWLFK